MKNPLSFIPKNVISHIYDFKENYLDKSARRFYCKKTADFIFNRSKETALIMLFFNSVSILSSHISQIAGLRRTKRENKDYLINQEWKELGLDLALTIVPPFLLNNYLVKKFDSGEWTTKSARKYLTDVIAPTVGASRDELYNIDHIKPFKESIKDGFNNTCRFLKNSKIIPQSLSDKIPMTKNNFNASVPMVSLADITTDFDVIRKGNFKPFYNGKAYDEINGQRNGLLILATIAYTVIASNIIMPILKNKLSNYSYKKQLEKQGETPETVKIKKRFSYNAFPVIKPNENLFNPFISAKKQENPKELFKPFMSSSSFNSNKMKI